jgi:hypothetical protein
MKMPNIKPVSYLRNYTEVLKEVSYNSPVYLTRNGRGEYTMVRLMAQLEEGGKSAREKG